MSSNQYFWRMFVAVVVLLLTGLVLVAQAALCRADGCSLERSLRSTRLDQMYQGHATAFLKSKTLNADGFGTLMQSIKAEQYLGRKVQDW
jgi:hypothetical protein